MINIGPKLTVIMPSYNQVDFIERSINSIVSQSYKNIELLVLDGGSTDGTIEILEKYSSKITYWKSELDKGQSHAINKGLLRATGDWICWQNSDDIFYPNAFAKIIECIEKNPKKDLLIGDINIIDANDNVISQVCYVKPTYKSILAEGMMLTNQAAFWRRDIHQKIGLLNEDLHYGFDYEWFLRLLKYTNRTKHIPITIGGLRYHENTKTSLYQELFNKEYETILLKSKLGDFSKFIFLCRRTILLAINGKLKYLLRGINKRLIKRLSNFYG